MQQAPGVQTTESVLDKIVAAKIERLADRMREVPEAALASPSPAPVLPLGRAIRDSRLAPGTAGRIAIVAEIKKASPSKGRFVANIEPVSIARSYAAAGAVGISIVTEENFFEGERRWLRDVRHSLDHAIAGRRPSLLRKDFLIDPYEVAEAKALGADDVLLIVAMLDNALLADMLAKVEAEGIEALVEVHNEAEAARAIKAGATLFGINNRDLHTFDVDLGTTERIRPLLPPDAIVIGESGVASRADVERLEKAGVNAILVGESFMLAANVKAKMDELRR